MWKLTSEALRSMRSSRLLKLCDLRRFSLAGRKGLTVSRGNRLFFVIRRADSGVRAPLFDRRPPDT